MWCVCMMWVHSNVYSNTKWYHLTIVHKASKRIIHPQITHYFLYVCSSVCHVFRLCQRTFSYAEPTSFPGETNYLSYYFTIFGVVYMVVWSLWSVVVCSRLYVCFGHTIYTVHICHFVRGRDAVSTDGRSELIETKQWNLINRDTSNPNSVN